MVGPTLTAGWAGVFSCSCTEFCCCGIAKGASRTGTPRCPSPGLCLRLLLPTGPGTRLRLPRPGSPGRRKWRGRRPSEMKKEGRGGAEEKKRSYAESL